MEIAKIELFIAYIYDKFGVDPHKKVLSTQELHAEIIEYFE